MYIVNVEQMKQAEQDTINHGVAVEQLMERAGAAVVREITRRFSVGNVVVLCGSGHNGGDGFVIARLLQSSGWYVSVVAVCEVHSLRNASKGMYHQWQGAITPFSEVVLSDQDLIVDALFGTGLARDITGQWADVVQSVNHSNIPVVAVDIPSGVSADDGRILGIAVSAVMTVTFAYKKPGHVLFPGRSCCGEVVIADIGIGIEHYMGQDTLLCENGPAYWQKFFPVFSAVQHKYQHGHVTVIGGDIICMGAAKLAAYAALRIGAGVVTVLCSERALPFYGTALTSILCYPADTVEACASFLSDDRKKVVLLGPGNGVHSYTKERVLCALAMQKKSVIDADALTVFAQHPEELFSAIGKDIVLTPHRAEFLRIFSVPAHVIGKVAITRWAAQHSGAVIVLKGADTVIAAPDGRAVVNCNAPPWLATAGSGDVLAGIIAGLMAMGMESFYAACAAVWIHGQAAQFSGYGMIAEDIPSLLPKVLEHIDQL